MTVMTPRFDPLTFVLMTTPPVDPDAHRFVHVIGTSVFVDDTPAEEFWPRRPLDLECARSLTVHDVDTKTGLSSAKPLTQLV